MSLTTTTTSHLAISPRSMEVTSSDGQVLWAENGDLSVGLYAARADFRMPHNGESGHVVIALDVDGGGWSEVATSARIGETPVDVIDRAIKALTLARAGLTQATSALTASHRPDRDVPGYCTCGTLTRLCEAQR